MNANSDKAAKTSKELTIAIDSASTSNFHGLTANLAGKKEIPRKVGTATVKENAEASGSTVQPRKQGS
jgi:hypothetical protein